jgi:hypothetical protein
VEFKSYYRWVFTVEYFDFQAWLYEKDSDEHYNGIEKPDQAESDGNQGGIFYSQGKRQEDSK